MLTFLASLFILGGWLFWLLVFIDFVVITALVENESGLWATLVAIGSILGLNYVWKVPVLKLIHDNPLRTGELIGLYFLLGATWSFFKWWTFLHKEDRKYQEFKADFLERNKATALTPELSVKLEDALSDRNRGGSYNEDKRIHDVPPSARQFKGVLIRWATYWPFSMVGFALNDIVRKAWNYIYDLLQGTYQRISNYMFRSAVADRAMAAEYRAKQELEAKAAAAADRSASYGTIDQPRRGNANSPFLNETTI